VGTAGTVKSLTPQMVRETGAEIILGNTYHLMLRPGAERIAALGGLHRFMGWDGPILTDSGGFQVMSLAELRSLDEAGVTFRSHLDGTTHHLTPERAIEIQRLLGSDISMVLDECLALPAAEDEIRRAHELSLRWAARCRTAFTRRSGHGLFGIVQGGTVPALRTESARALVEMGFDGYAIGGLAVGETQAAMFEVIDVVAAELPADRPRYLMGVGKPGDMVGAVRRGVDMFDCVLPTRSGRTGQAFTRRGTLNIRNARHADDPRPIDPACLCQTCRGFTRAYLRHLFRAKEILGCTLLTLHNVHYYQELMGGLRVAVAEGRLEAFARSFEHEQAEGDLPPV
jgi:queuine tRNA-ribosyltransferase